MFAFRLVGAWMRGISRSAGLALLFAAVFAAGQLTRLGQLEASAIAGINTVTLTPTHGRAASAFSALYRITPCLASPGVSIEFSWNGLPPGAGQALGTATLDSSCRATLSTTPPLNPATHQAPAPGTYTVYGFVPLPTGGPTTGTVASAIYTVDLTPTPTPTATPTPAPTSTTTATSTAPPRSSSSASASASATQEVTSPSASAIATSQPSASQSARGQTAPSGGSTTPLWWRTVGGLVILGGASLGLLLIALLTLLILRVVEGRGARSTYDRARDKAA
jgi:hypothetical protein